MGGVDKHDMLRQLYEINRKSMKWWHRLLFSSLDMAVVNVFHNVSKEQQLLFLEFRRDLAMGLLTRTFARGCRSSGVPKKCKIAYSVLPSVRLSNVEVHLPQSIKKADLKCFWKKEWKLYLLASVLIATSIVAATLQKLLC